MSYISHESSSHFYQWNGTEVTPEYDAGLTEARKRGLFVSPTTLEKDVRYTRALDIWKQNQIISAVLRVPAKTAEEDDKAYGKRVTTEAFKPSATASNFGTRLHDAIEEYPQMTTEAATLPWMTLFDEWYHANIIDTLFSERMVAWPLIGVAGRLDRIVHHKDHGAAIIDWKTQGIKKGKSAAFYDSWPRQLAFYRQAAAVQLGTPMDAACMSAVIDSTQPSAPAIKVWSRQEMDRAWLAFLCTAWLWFEGNDYWPVGYWEPKFFLAGAEPPPSDT